MKIKNIIKKASFKKLSSTHVLIIIIANISVPFLSPLISRLIIYYQVKYKYINGVSQQYYDRVSFLVLVFLILCILVLNVIFILNPLIRVENIIKDFRESKELYNGLRYYDKNSALEATFFEILKEQKESMERIYKTEMLRKETELIALQSQINPHFLYNTLDSIRGLALLNDVVEIADMTEALSKLFRNMIAKEGKLISLREEFESVDNYMIIQQFRFNNRFKYVKKVDDEKLYNYKVPNLVLQPIIENAIIHGLEKIKENGKVTVSAYLTQKRLIINVEDNGVGMNIEKLDYLNSILGSNTEEHNKQKVGIALKNINQRIKLQFGKDYGINIMSSENINTVVEIILPIIKNED
ncbi:MAG: sensor histidine kinase [bacterium]